MEKYSNSQIQNISFETLLENKIANNTLRNTKCYKIAVFMFEF